MRINVIFDHYKMYYYKAQTTCYSLRKLGIESDLFCPFPYSSKKVVRDHIYPNADYYLILNDLHFDNNIIPKNSKTIWSYNAHVDFDSNHPTIQKLNNKFKTNYENHDYVITTYPMIKEEMEKIFPIHGLIGFYDDNLKSCIMTGKKEKEDDIIFCGNLHTERRKNIIRNAPLNIKHIYNSFLGEYYSALAKSKISLNVHPYSSNEASTCFGFLRIANAILQKSLVISEPIKNSAPLIPGEHFVMVDLEDMFDACQHYLENEEKRIEIVNNAFQYIQNNYRMDDVLYDFIKNNINEDFERKNLEVEIPKVQGILE